MSQGDVEQSVNKGGVEQSVNKGDVEQSVNKGVWNKVSWGDEDKITSWMIDNVTRNCWAGCVFHRHAGVSICKIAGHKKSSARDNSGTTPPNYNYIITSLIN